MDCAPLMPLSHSAPTINWWLGLNASEQAAWTAAIMGLLAACGGFAAAWASYRAASAALKIADDQAKREEARSARRAEVHAAYMFNELAEFKAHIPSVQAPASEVPAHRGDRAILDTVGRLRWACIEWDEMLARIPVDSIGELPDGCAAHTAAAISSARYVIKLGKVIPTKWDKGVFDVDFAERAAQVITEKCVEISRNLQSYVDYANGIFTKDKVI